MCQVELQSSYIWLLESTRHRFKDWSHPSDRSWFTEQVTYLFLLSRHSRQWSNLAIGRKWARDSALKKDRSSLHVSSKKLLYIQLRLKMMTLTEVSEVLVCSWKRRSSQALEIAAESKDTLGKGILEFPKKSWKKAPSMFACLPHPNWMNVSILFTVVRSFIRVQVDLIQIYRDHGNTRSAIDSDIMIDRLLHCTFFVRVFVSHAVLSKWKSTVVSLLTAEIALLLVTGTLLKARQGCKRRSKRIDSMHAESTQIHHARSTFLNYAAGPFFFCFRLWISVCTVGSPGGFAKEHCHSSFGVHFRIG